MLFLSGFSNATCIWHKVAIWHRFYQFCQILPHISGIRILALE
ncbi:hypothetical protein [Hippea alviniae]|nr:hypothetical protein [Hippea alviniae]